MGSTRWHHLFGFTQTCKDTYNDDTCCLQNTRRKLYFRRGSFSQQILTYFLSLALRCATTMLRKQAMNCDIPNKSPRAMSHSMRRLSVESGAHIPAEWGYLKHESGLGAVMLTSRPPTGLNKCWSVTSRNTRSKHSGNANPQHICRE